MVIFWIFFDGSNLCLKLCTKSLLSVLILTLNIFNNKKLWTIQWYSYLYCDTLTNYYVGNYLTLVIKKEVTHP